MLTAAECRALAAKYKSMAQRPDASEDRAAITRNIARTFTGLASQLDRLAANIRDEARSGRVSAQSRARPGDFRSST
ncbi:hypothetical protein ACFFWD_18025 [Bradyrhizobium erythrophlei]|uniref:hypothetical protein n=1 Tax=Bradyrhizobium erythrophlei TaxID=1437360 RepID=UPI0035EBFDF2